MRLLKALSLVSVLAAACGGSSGGGGGEPPVEPNDAPSITAPGGLSGGPVLFVLTLGTAGDTQLEFIASDPNSDPLQWQAAMSAADQAATGLRFTTPLAANVFTLIVDPVTTPAAATLSLLVEDGKGGVAAIDVRVVRSGSPGITSVTPNSAFVSAAQEVTVTGTALSLDGTAEANATFGGIAATDTVLDGETTLMCLTPVPGVIGPNQVRVVNQFGSDTLPASEFTMYAHPIDLFATDTALDGGAGSSLATAHEGAVLQSVYIEGGAVVHRRSTDAGATWEAAQPLSGGEVPSEPRVVVDGADVTVVWIGDGSAVWSRRSTNAGETFASAVQVNPLAGGAPVANLRIAASGAQRFCAWLSGSAGIGLQRVHAAGTDNVGASWTQAGPVSDQGANQFFPAIGCDGATAWVAYADSPIATGGGVYTSRTADGGASWSTGERRSVITGAVSDIVTCNDGARVQLAWVRSGKLEFVTSTNSGLGWSTQATLLRDDDLGSISNPVMVCEGQRLFCAYVAGGNNIAFTRVGAAGAAPESVTVSDTVEEVSRPSLVARGRYCIAAWRGGAVGGGAGPARIRFASSVDTGESFTAPAGYGDGSAAQDLPQLLLDGARLWLGWLDFRGATPALFGNRTEQ